MNIRKLNATMRDFAAKTKKMGLQHRTLAGLHGRLRGDTK